MPPFLLLTELYHNAFSDRTSDFSNLLSVDLQLSARREHICQRLLHEDIQRV